jgi:hypothetical protein
MHGRGVELLGKCAEGEPMWGRATLALLPTWQEWAIAVFECLRTTLLRYSEGAKMFRGTYLTDAELDAPRTRICTE